MDDVDLAVMSGLTPSNAYPQIDRGVCLIQGAVLYLVLFVCKII